MRPVPLEVHISGFSGKHYCPRMATMNKPAYSAIKTYSPNKPVISMRARARIRPVDRPGHPDRPLFFPCGRLGDAPVFVASRRQTRLTAQELISLCGVEDNPRQVVPRPDGQASLSALLIQWPMYPGATVLDDARRGLAADSGAAS